MKDHKAAEQKMVKAGALIKQVQKHESDLMKKEMKEDKSELKEKRKQRTLKHFLGES